MSPRCVFCDREKRDTSLGFVTTDKFQAPVVCSECVKLMNAAFARKDKVEHFRCYPR
jgi:uncharacterized protein with ATP-grasp and redox domains